jgi:hypothetical protein
MYKQFIRKPENNSPNIRSYEMIVETMEETKLKNKQGNVKFYLSAIVT